MWSDGRTHVILSPHELIEKLCALVPLPYVHLVRYSGVFAPHAKMRKGVIPGFTRAEIKAQKDAKKEGTTSLQNKSSWAKLLARVFEIDISKCLRCGGEMKFTSPVTDPIVIKKILTHCGLMPRPPPVVITSSQEIFAS